jgi:hypothetical protein
MQTLIILLALSTVSIPVLTEAAASATHVFTFGELGRAAAA